MNTTSRRALEALSMALALAAGAPASAQLSVTANGPYMAVPAWSQKLTRNRFVVLADWKLEAVLDRETGLVWQRSPGSVDLVLTWSSAVGSCQSSWVGGRMGWRLAELHEMLSLVDPSMPSHPLRLPDGHPFVLHAHDPAAPNFYWSTTRNVGSPNDSVMMVSFDWSILTPGAVSGFARSWCVRSGAAAAVR